MRKILCIVVLLLCMMTGCTRKGDSGMKIQFFSEDKADVILISTENTVVMIDTGLDEDADDVLDWMEDLGVSQLDALIITHFDKDHVGGADRIIEEMDIKAIYTSYETKSSTDIKQFKKAVKKAGLKAEVVEDEVVFQLDGVTYQLIGATYSYQDKESNNSSLITAVAYGECTYLFMGDAQDERIEEFLSMYEIQADFIKIPYHGHYQDSLENLLEQTGVKDAVITNGKSEPDEDELQETLYLLKRYGIHTYLTVNGNISIYCNPNTYTIHQNS